MSKIYEALEIARRHLKKPSSTPAPETPSAFQLDMEHEMMGIYQAIYSAGAENKELIIQLIGSNPGEGTSTISRELAKALSSKLFMNVLLIDADSANPSQQQHFDVVMNDNLQNVVERGLPVAKACCQVPDSTLWLCFMSEDPSSISKLCQNDDLDRVWKEIRETYSTIIIDSPPGNTSPVGFDLCRKADMVVFVIEAEKTRWPVANHIKEKIVNNGGNILGIVFNKRKFYIPGWLYRRL